MLSKTRAIWSLSALFFSSVFLSSWAEAECRALPAVWPDDLPSQLSQLGLFEDLTSLKPCPSLVEYEINSPLWSDGAVKRRWYIPPQGQKIQFSAEDPWKFPPGTVLIKNFELKTGANSQTRVETRILINRGDDDWTGYSYQWNEDQKDAVLLDDSANREYTVYNPETPSVPKKQTWSYPSPRACLECHNPWSGYVLGPSTGQLNKPLTETSKNQLDLWNERGYFDKNIGNASRYKSYSAISDASQTLETRAKSYLAANCAQCHQPESPVRAHMDFRFKIPLENMNIVGKKANAGDLGIPNSELVYPGNKELSILWLRLKAQGGSLHMPPIGVSELDPEAIKTIGQWIDQLPSTLTP